LICSVKGQGPTAFITLKPILFRVRIANFVLRSVVASFIRSSLQYAIIRNIGDSISRFLLTWNRRLRHCKCIPEC